MFCPHNKHSHGKERWQSPLDGLTAARIEAAMILLRLIRCGAVCCFFAGTEALETAYDLHRAGLITLASEFEPETVGLYWTVTKGGPRQ